MSNITVKNKILPRVEDHSHIEIEFKLSLLDGTLVEETDKAEVFSFQIGDGQFLNKLDELLIGLELGTRAKFNLMPDQAFGKSDPSNFQDMSRAEFSKDLDLEEGSVVGFNTPAGEEVLGTVLKLTSEVVTVDFNHPLADKMLVFEATIMAIKD